MPTGPFLIVSLVLTTLLSLAVYEVRRQDKEIAVLEMAHAIQEQAIKHKKELETAVAAIQEDARERIETLQFDLDTANTDLLRRSIHAEYAASETPMEFGDDWVRDLIRADCMWSLGENQGDIRARASCDREAQLADTSRAGIPVSVITPEFRDLWYDACQDWAGIGTSRGVINYTIEDWKAEYGTFDSRLCHQTVVAFTPGFSYYLRDFINKREGYTARVTNFAKENIELLEVVTKTRPKTDSTTN